jgi:hypothetical protein
LLHPGEPPVVADFDWLRVELPHDVAQDTRVTVRFQLPPIAEPGAYLAVCDLVIEGFTWFAERGSKTVTLAIHVD